MNIMRCTYCFNLIGWLFCLLRIKVYDHHSIKISKLLKLLRFRTQKRYKIRKLNIICEFKYNSPINLTFRFKIKTMLLIDINILNDDITSKYFYYRRVVKFFNI